MVTRDDTNTAQHCPARGLARVARVATVLAAIEPVAVELQTNVSKDYAKFYHKGQAALRHYANQPADPL